MSRRLFPAFAIAFSLWLLPTLAAAQSFPLTMPAQTVYGRLGIPGKGGPGQAIPFANLLSNLSGIAWGGQARMIPHVGQTASPSDCYTLTDPYGNAIACTTSTTTQGLQEFLNAAAANGWPAVTYCQGTLFPSLTEPIYINATTSVTVPVSQDWSYHSYGCNLNSTVPTASALIADSAGAGVFDWDGKIVYSPSNPNGAVTINPSCVVLIQPSTSTADGFPGLYAGYFRVKSPVANPLGGTKNTGVVCINTSGGSTIEQRLDFTEVNANNLAYFGVFVFGATGTTGLLQTEININQIHGAVTAGVNEGYSASNQVNYNGNQWKINNIENNGTASRGIDTWGSYDNFQIGVINNAQGGLQNGIVTEANATANHFDYGNITVENGGAAIVDTGTCTWYNGPQGSQLVIWSTSGTCTKLSTQINTATLAPNPSQGAGAWLATDPFGKAISTAGTTCQGFDSLLAAASANGWSWRVMGSGTLSCTAPIAVPTCVLRNEYIDSAVSISFSAQTSNPLVTLDSHENCNVAFLGQVIQHSGDTGPVIDLKPTTNDTSGNTVMAASTFAFNVPVPASGGIGIKLDSSIGGIIGNEFHIQDINGGATGLQITNPGSGSIAFEQNRFFLGYLHGQTTRVVQIGTSTTNQTNMRFNAWHISRIDPNGGTVAWDTWGTKDSYFGLAIDNETSAATTGLKLESGASANNFFGGHVAATTNLSDGGIGNKFYNVDGVSDAILFASLPACTSTLEGFSKGVTDSTTATWGATITGSSTNHVLAYCDGTNWTVAAK